MTQPTPSIIIAASGIYAEPCSHCGFRLKARNSEGKVHCLLCGWPRAGNATPDTERSPEESRPKGMA